MDKFEELIKLKELLDEGIITQEEFDERKQSILDADANCSEETNGLSNKSSGYESKDASNSNHNNTTSVDLNSFKCKSENFYCQALYYLGWAIIILGVIGSIILENESYSAGGTMLVVGLFSTAVSGFLILGLSEIINILNESRKMLLLMASNENSKGKME